MSRPSPARPGEMRDTRRHSRGQTLAEFGITLPLLMAVILGIFQVSYLIYQQYVAVNLARVGANLILRKSPFDAAAAASRRPPVRRRHEPHPLGRPARHRSRAEQG